MVKKKEVKKKEQPPFPVKTRYRCNTCGRTCDTKDCCGNDFTTQLN